MRSIVDILRSRPRVRLQARCSFSAGRPIRLRARVGTRARAFSGSAYNGGVMYPVLTVNGKEVPGAVVIDLDSLQIPQPQRPVLYEHDESADGRIGHTTAIAVRKSDYTLPVEGVLFAQLPHAQTVLSEVEAGRQWELSVGTSNFALQHVAAGEGCRVNGRGFTGPLTIVRNAELTDLSFVRSGGDATTWARVAARRGLFKR